MHVPEGDEVTQLHGLHGLAGLVRQERPLLLNLPTDRYNLCINYYK